MIKRYRGLIADGAQDTIPLHTSDGKTGYRIVKFQIMGEKPGDSSSGSYEHIIKIYSVEQDTVDGVVNFNDQTLLAAGLNFAQTSPQFDGNKVVIFDNVVFNQDIYITHIDGDSSTPGNYHIELEQIDLSESQALVSIIKNLKNEQ